MAAGRGRGWAASRGPVHEASHPRRARKRAEATQEPTAPAPGGATGTLRGPRSTWPRVFRPLGSVSSTGRRREWFPPKGTRAPPRGPRVSPQAPRGSGIRARALGQAAQKETGRRGAWGSWVFPRDHCAPTKGPWMWTRQGERSGHIRRVPLSASSDKRRLGRATAGRRPGRCRGRAQRRGGARRGAVLPELPLNCPRFWNPINALSTRERKLTGMEREETPKMESTGKQLNPTAFQMHMIKSGKGREEFTLRTDFLSRHYDRTPTRGDNTDHTRFPPCSAAGSNSVTTFCES